MPGAGGVRLLCGPRLLKPPNHGRAECRAQRMQEPLFAKQRYQDQTGLSDDRWPPRAQSQARRKRSAVPGLGRHQRCPHPGLAWPRASACPAGVGERLTLHRGELAGCLGVRARDAPQTALLHPGRRDGRRRPQMELWEEGRCLPTPRIIALEHWEEVGQKGIKAVFTAHRGHKAPAGLATLSGLLPRDRPKVTG